MQKTEFIQRMIGIPWADRACAFDACDCWGLVVLYYRHVLGIELHHSAGYEAGEDFLTCYWDEVVFWHSTDTPYDDCVFVGYVGDRAEHIGLIVDGAALHSRGEGGGVRHDRLRVIERMFTKVEYLTHADYRDSTCTRAG
ncbi:NlpC/P60 family protein [Serratia marcescens]|uniref:NlpC/P60 family protein n=1 Tax=Serratia marcescens TaxID=615 RepID=UPI001EFF1B31|nr:NlpC/P60 family protein [Serratia marcescens]